MPHVNPAPKNCKGACSFFFLTRKTKLRIIVEHLTSSQRYVYRLLKKNNDPGRVGGVGACNYKEGEDNREVGTERSLDFVPRFPVFCFSVSLGVLHFFGQCLWVINVEDHTAHFRMVNANTMNKFTL